MTATNREADKLSRNGRRADVVVLLVHEGAATTSYASATDPTSDFGKIVNGVDEDVDAIVSGHTHLAYNHEVPVGVGRRGPRRHDASRRVGRPVRQQPEPAAVHGGLRDR